MLSCEQFSTIINLQKKLDLNIIKIRNVTEKATLTPRFLALLVELGEFANEQRCFKYWSSKVSSPKSVLLEEYIDSLHFILSIGNTLQVNYANFQFSSFTNYQDLNIAFIDLFASVTKLFATKLETDFFHMLNLYFLIGKINAFTNEDIIDGYKKKNDLNHLRQAQNY